MPLDEKQVDALVEGAASGFRRCIVASPDCRLIELDFSAIEAVILAWFANDPVYYRFAKLGVHAIMASQILALEGLWERIDESWDDTAIKASASALKASKIPRVELVYNASKRTVHMCLTPEHEVLTPEGWIRVDTIKDGVPIAQWDRENDMLSWSIPSRWVREDYIGKVIRIHGIAASAVMTPQHRIPFRYSATNAPWQDCTAGALPTQGRVPTQAPLEGQQRIPEALVQLIVAIQADASVQKGGVVFHLVKERKIARLRQILSDLDIAYRQVACACHPTGVRIRPAQDGVEQALAWLAGKDKVFDVGALLSLTLDLRKTFIAELVHWDGSHSGDIKNYRSTVRDNVVAVQTVAASIGMQGLVREVGINMTHGHLGRKPCWSVSFNARKQSRIEAWDVTVEDYSGLVYCPTVATGYFLIKHDDRISITGNSGYGATPAGMHDRMPSLFPTISDAKWFQNFYFSMAPKIRQTQIDLQTRAAKQHYLGGPGQHPFGFKHWFWNVHNWVRIKRDDVARIEARGGIVREAGGNFFEIKLGEDAKRCVAFLPQSTAAAIIRLCGLRLFGSPEAREEAFGSRDAFASSYIGDLYYGVMPLRAIIHDSFLLEVPEERCEEAITKGLAEMRRPVAEMPLPWNPSEYLTLDADVKIGANWAPADDTNPDGMRKWKPSEAPSEAALDRVVDLDEEDDDEDDESEGEE